jgi:hypothetical protein
LQSRLTPLPTATAAALAARMPAAAVTDLIEWGPEFNIDLQLDNVLSRERSIDEMIARAPRVPPLQDDQPVNEYYALRSWFRHYR